MKVPTLLLAAILCAPGYAGAQANPPAGAAPSASAAAPATASSSGACDLDFAKICQAFLDQPTFYVRGVQTDRAMMDQSNVRHPEFELPLKMANGDFIVSGICQFDSRTLKVSHANALSGPAMTAAGVDFLRKLGWCSDQNPDFAKNLTVEGNPLRDGAK